MTNNTLHRSITSLSLALCLTAVLGTGEAREQAKPNGEQTAAPETPTRNKKQSNKAKARNDRQLMVLLESGEATPDVYAECLAQDASRIAATVDHPSNLGVAVIKALKHMPREKVRNQILPALEEKFQEMLNQKFETSGVTSQVSRSTANAVIIEGRYVNMVNALAAIGPDAHPVLVKGLGYNPAVDLFITRKLGEEAKAAVQGLLENPTNAEWYWLGYYAAVLAEPGKDSVPILLEKMKEDDRDYGKYIRMVLDSIGADAVPQVVEALGDPDWFARFSAARTFEMMGPKAKGALPALEKRFNDTAEDIEVRVAAARAIARIKGIDKTSLYSKIPDLRSKLVRSSREKSLSWRNEYMRREALKRTALAGAGVWIGSQTQQARAASPNEKLNIACIGVGGRGHGNIKELTEENLVAFCDVDDVCAGKKTYAMLPNVRRFRDFRKMFDVMENDIDAVVVSTPDHTHFHPSMWALERGKHLYCEKPMAHNVWEIRQMTELAREKKVATQLGVQRHALENVHRVVELVKSGVLGEFFEVYAWYNSGRGMPADARTGEKIPSHLDWDLWLGPVQERAYSSSYCPYEWRFWWDFGTGEAGNWGCHILDIPFWALGLDHPTRVEATGPEVDPEKTPKSMVSKLQFAGNDQRGPVTLHWSASPPKTLTEKKLDLRGANVAFTGTEGTLLCGFNRLSFLPEDKVMGHQPVKRTIPESPGFHQEWINAAKGAATPPTCQFDYSGPLSEAVLLANVAYRAGEGFDWDAQNLKTVGNPKAQALIREEYRKGWEL